MANWLSVCTYNCNGLASVKQYASNNSTLAGVLEQLGAGVLNAAARSSCTQQQYSLTLRSPSRVLFADIVCFQETKLSRPDLWPVAFQRIAAVQGWSVPDVNLMSHLYLASCIHAHAYMNVCLMLAEACAVSLHTKHVQCHCTPSMCSVTAHLPAVLQGRMLLLHTEEWLFWSSDLQQIGSHHGQGSRGGTSQGAASTKPCLCSHHTCRRLSSGCTRDGVAGSSRGSSVAPGDCVPCPAAACNVHSRGGPCCGQGWPLHHHR
jgi:hypothetical protein